MDVREHRRAVRIVSRLRAVDEKRLRRPAWPSVRTAGTRSCPRSRCSMCRAHRAAVRQAAARRRVRAHPGAWRRARAIDPRRVHALRYQRRSRRAGGGAQRTHLTFLTDVPLFVGGDLNARAALHDDAVLALASRLPLASCGTGRTNRWPLRLDVLIPDRPARLHVRRDADHGHGRAAAKRCVMRPARIICRC